MCNLCMFAHQELCKAAIEKKLKPISFSTQLTVRTRYMLQNLLFAMLRHNKCAAHIAGESLFCVNIGIREILLL